MPWRPSDRPSSRTGVGRLAARVALAADLAVARRLDVQPLGQRVDDADADAVQAAGDLVAAAAELAAGVEHGVHDLEGVLAGLLLPPDRHAAAVVLVAHAAVGQDANLDARGVAGHRLVDGVVDDLPDEVVQAAAVGRADVHARPPADRLEALEDLDALGGVALGLGGRGPSPGGRCRPRRRVCGGRRSDRFGHAVAPGEPVDQALEVVVTVVLDRDAARHDAST